MTETLLTSTPQAAVRTYGQLAWGKLRANGRPVWGIKAEPHVHMRIKRILPRVDSDSSGVIYVQDTPETARDIEWLLERFPLRMKPEVAARLHERAAEHRRAQDAVTRILGGYSPPTDWREPARTARSYQQQASDIVHAKGWLLLGDDVGLGKTVSALLVLRNPESLPAVVVCPTHLPDQWLGELRATLPWLTGHIIKTGKQYDVAKRCGGRMPDVLILSYSKLAKWAPFLAGWARTVIYDEIQDLRHGEATEKGRGAKMVSRASRFRMGLSATPIHGYGHEIHTVIDMLEEDALGSRDEFVREWGGAAHGRGGDQYEVKDPKALGTYLRDQGMMLIRTRKDVGREIPEPIRITQPVEADTAKIAAVADDVLEMARLLLDDSSDHRDRFVAAGEIDWRLRQATGVAKAPFVAEFVKLLLEREEKVVLWGWHRDCFAPGTKVLMYDGTTKNVEDVAVGDVVMGPDSTPRRVMSLVRGRGQLYRVTPKKGDPWVCSENHILTVRNERGGYEKVTAREFAKASPRWQRRRTLYRAESVAFGGGQPVAEPWLLGYWLGDGAASLRDLRVVSADPEVEDEVRGVAARHGLVVRVWPNRGATGTSNAKHLALSSGLVGPKNRNTLVQHFRSLGLHQNKRIPHSYAVAPAEDRLELLAGLIDSDGHASQGNGVGTATYTTTSRGLAEDVAFVARSLGFAAYIKTRSKSATGYAPAGTYFNVSISGDLTRVPTRIERKRAGQRTGQKNVLRTGFTVEPTEVGDYYGFEVDGDHLFLLADFTVVHNCYDIWLNRLRRYRPVLYTGSESAAGKNRSAQEFIEGDARVLIMSLRSGSGLNGLQKVASVGVFGELDWSPAVHEQCIGRLWRDGQDAAVTAFYMLSEDGSDPFIADVLGVKDGQWAGMKDPDARLAQPIGNPGERARQLAAWALARAQHEAAARAGQTSLV